MNDIMQALYVWNWSNLYPDYSERMAAMSHPCNVDIAFVDASFLSLQPKE